jgi:hypothetical protein
MTTTTDATSTTAAGVKISGGVGIAKSLYVGGEVNINTTTGSRLKLQTTNNFFFVGGVNGDAAGDFHIYDATASSRLMGWYRAPNEIRLGFYNGSTNVLIAGTADAASATSGALQVAGGIAVGKSLYVANGLNAFGTSALNILNVTGPSTLNSVSVTGLTQDIFTRSVVSNANTANKSFARALAFQSTNAQVDFDTFEIRNASGATVMRTQFGNGATNFKSGLYTAEGNLGLGSSANGSTIDTGVVATLSAIGTGASASLDFLVNGTGNDRMFRWYRAGNPANPLMYLGTDGSLTSGNYSTGTVSSATTQAGVTFTKTTDALKWSKTGSIAEVFYQFVISAQSGTQTGPLSFTLPVAAALTCTMDSGYFLYRNGTQATNVRLNFTQGAANVTVTMNNGFGAYNAFALQNTENFNLMFQYPTV